MKRDPVDVENLGGAALIATAFLENMEDVGALNVV
jgi:hypothetical protein